MKIFRLRPQHFVLALISLILFCHIQGNNMLKEKFQEAESSQLIDIGPESITDTISKGTCFVLFYTPGSALCLNMEQKLNKIASNRMESAGFYKVNISDSETIADRYNISGIPNILIFKDGKEQNRVMGIVPYSNLEMIYKREIQ